MKEEGLIRHLGLSNVTRAQMENGRAIREIVCLQNHFNVAHREDDALVDALSEAGIAYVPFFPPGGSTPLQSSTLSDVATRLGVTTTQVALAWLLRHPPNALPIPGTSSLDHLRENLAAARLELSEDALDELSGMAGLDAAPGR